MAIGGYTSAILVVHHGWTDWKTIPVAGLVAGVAGLAFGIPALRLSGLYLALAPFALAVSMPALIKKWESQTGGSSGLLLPTFHSNVWYYRTTWITAGILFVLGWLLLQTKFSRAWRAIRDSEIAAASMGVNLALYKTAAFGASALFAGVAGALLVILSFSANPGSFPVQLSIYLVVGLAVAGLGSLVGLLVGAAFVEYVQVWTPEISKSPGVPTFAFGAALVLVMYLLPGGAAGLVGRLHNSVAHWRGMRFLAVLLLAFALVAGASGATRTDPGVSSSSIKIGGTVPLSGVAAAYASVGRGADAYFKYWNDTHGGVNGRKIDYDFVDDAYDPAQTVEQTRKLVQQDQVFAIVNSLGTEQNLAVRGFLNQLKVPQLFVATGATEFGADYKHYPWSIGFLPSYTAEGIIYGKYVRANKPTAKIAVLYQADSFGGELLGGLKKGLGPLAGRVVKNVSYVSSASNIMKISASSSNNLTTGSISIADFKDPTNPQFAKDKTMKLYRQILAKYQPGADASDVYHVYAMAVAYTFIDALRHAGNPPTRAGMMRAVTHLNVKNPFVLPGITVTTTPTDRFPIKQAQLEVWKGSSWKLIGKPLSARG